MLLRCSICGGRKNGLVGEDINSVFSTLWEDDWKVLVRAKTCQSAVNGLKTYE